MLHQIHEVVWGPGMLCLFLAVGIFYSIRLLFFPIFGFGRWWKTTVGSFFSQNKAGADKTSEKSHISSFQSACTALAATIGTGNIAGVATALLAGGPGAIFWMWVSAFLGMATAYGETELGIRYRRRMADGGWMSGPMLYMERGLHNRLAAVLYGGLAFLASFGMGSMVQANAISETLEFSFSLPPVVIGCAVTLLAGRVIAGGSGSIARTAETMVPVSAGIYMAASIAMLVVFRERLPEVFRMIFSDAFSFRSAAGGAAGAGVGQCIRYGVARGVFSNEAGLGSLAVLNGGAEDVSPGVQGQWAIFEVFFDTIVSCTLTALVILCAVGADPRGMGYNGAELTGLCFSMGLGNLGGYLVSLCIVLFAFATIIAWYYMGKQAVAYLGDVTGRNFSGLYMTGYLGAVFLGSLWPMETVWEMSDIFNGIMAAPNLLALIFLVREVKRPGR